MRFQLQKYNRNNRNFIIKRKNIRKNSGKIKRKSISDAAFALPVYLDAFWQSAIIKQSENRKRSGTYDFRKDDGTWKKPVGDPGDF